MSATTHVYTGGPEQHPLVAVCRPWLLPREPKLVEQVVDVVGVGPARPRWVHRSPGFPHGILCLGQAQDAAGHLGVRRALGTGVRDATDDGGGRRCARNRVQLGGDPLAVRDSGLEGGPPGLVGTGREVSDGEVDRHRVHQASLGRDGSGFPSPRPISSGRVGRQLTGEVQKWQAWDARKRAALGLPHAPDRRGVAPRARWGPARRVGKEGLWTPSRPPERTREPAEGPCRHPRHWGLVLGLPSGCVSAP